MKEIRTSVIVTEIKKGKEWHFTSVKKALEIFKDLQCVIAHIYSELRCCDLYEDSEYIIKRVPKNVNEEEYLIWKNRKNKDLNKKVA